MTDVSALIAETLSGHMDSLQGECSCGGFVYDHRDKWDEHVAAAVEAALAQHRLVVVELPEPLGVNGADNLVWSHGPFYVEQDFDGGVVISDRMGIDPDELADLGAILLAAAARAEEAK